MKPDRRLLIIEMVLPVGDTPHPGKIFDMMMMVGPRRPGTDGAEYGSLLKAPASGWHRSCLLPRP